MPSVADMQVRLEANIRDFDKNLKAAGVQLDAFENRTNRSASKIENAFSAAQTRIVAFAGAVAGLSIAGRTILTTLDGLATIGDMAERLTLSTDALQQFQFAAINTGSNVDNMNRALDIFTRRLADARVGQGELAQITSTYGIALVDAQGRARSVVDVYQDLANAVQSAVDPQEQLRIAVAAFGGQADELIPLLSRGAAGFRALADEAQNTGVIIDEAIIGKAAQFDQAWKNAMLRFRAFSFDAISVVGNEIQKRIIEFNSFKETGKFPKNVDGIIEVQSKTGGFKGLNLPPPPAVENKSPNPPSNSGKSLSGGGSSRNRAAQFDRGDEVLKDLNYKLENLKASNKEQEISNTLRRAGVDIETEQGRAIAETAGRLYDVTEQTKKQREALEDSRRSAEEFGRSLTSALGDIIFQGGNARSVISGLLSDLSRTLFNNATSPIMDAFSGAFGGLFSGGETINWFGPRVAGFASGGVMTSKGPAPLRRYSEGGVATTPQMALFGEGSKAEAYVPLSGGRNIPVEISGATGSGNIVQNINISTGVQDTVRAEVRRLLPEIQRSAIAGMQAARVRGVE